MANFEENTSYKNVRFPKHLPIDYQKMQQMSLNDQYLKDKIDAQPRGILLREYIDLDDTEFIYTDDIMVSYNFTCEENRLISYNLSPVYITETIFYVRPTTLYIKIDGEEYGKTSIFSYGSSPIYDYFNVFGFIDNLAAGEHTLTISSDRILLWTLFRGHLIVEDRGRYISQSTSAQE
jgi:hypothetical protein